MSYYRINYKQLRQNPEMGRMLDALERGFSRFDVDFYLVGALARDVWMRGIYDIIPSRGTSDVDFAILINAKGIYESLKNYLVGVEGFHPYRENSFVLIWNGKLEVDLLPFGKIENEGTVMVEGTGLTSIHVPGLKEVYEEGLPNVEIEDKHRFKFCTIPGIVLLKLLAWNDRPTERSDDIVDICDILRHYFQMHDEYIWEMHHDLFDEDTEIQLIASQVLGREIGKILSRNAKLKESVLQILGKSIENPAESDIGDIIARYFNIGVEGSIRLLAGMKKGIIEFGNRAGGSHTASPVIPGPP